MKSVTLKKPQPMDLFGLKLQPGPNDVEDAAWDKVKDLKLGSMDVPFVQYARAEGFILFDESPAKADEPGPGASDETAAPSAQDAAPGPEVAAPKKRGRPPKGT